MTKWLSHRMVERGIIKEEEQELYQFGIRNGMILLLNVVTALVIGLLTEQLAVVAVFTLSFMVLRSYTGGYHSDSRIFCYLGSNLVLLVPVYTQAVFCKTSLAWLLAVLLVSAGIIFLLSPMHSKNRKLEKAFWQKSKADRSFGTGCAWHFVACRPGTVCLRCLYGNLHHGTVHARRKSTVMDTITYRKWIVLSEHAEGTFFLENRRDDNPRR